jgi:hypothetical protein
MESIQQLSDSANEELQTNLIVKATSSRAQQVGSSAFVDVTVKTPPQLSTSAARAVEERLNRHISATLNLQFLMATVHAKPKLMMDVVFPLLQNQQQQDEDGDNHNDAVLVGSMNSASALEYLVQQNPIAFGSDGPLCRPKQQCQCRCPNCGYQPSIILFTRHSTTRQGATGLD